MNCPVDGSQLEKHAIQSVEVEECPQCHGMWFEKGELRQAKDEAEPDLNWLDTDLWSDQDIFKIDWSERSCPQCEELMATISYGATDVMVEYCFQGHGIWLDKGEFETIIGALEEEALAMDSSEYLQASLGEAKDLIGGGEGFASEWKDFHSVTRMLQYRLLADNPKLAERLIQFQKLTPFK